MNDPLSAALASRATPVIAGLMGWPVHLSKSPLIHRFWLDRAGIDGDYVRFPVPPGEAAAALRAMAALSITGLQATMPHKHDCYAAVDELSDDARHLGAVNTVVRLADGGLLGHNSDKDGFLEPLGGIDLADTVVTVLGAGGAASAIVAGLASKRPRTIRIVNRSAPAVDRLLGYVGPLLSDITVEVCGWDAVARAVDNATLIANATALGMAGQDELPLDVARLDPAAIVYDIVTNPVETRLLRVARGCGHRSFDGIDMLVGQARAAFAMFYGAAPSCDDDAALKAMLRT